MLEYTSSPDSTSQQHAAAIPGMILSHYVIHTSEVMTDGILVEDGIENMHTSRKFCSVAKLFSKQTA
jgi:hypothetical protein